MRPLGRMTLAVTFFLFFVLEGAWTFTQGITNPVVPNQMRRISLRQRSRQLSLAKLKTATDDKPLTLPAGVTLAPQLSLDSDGHVIAVGPIKHRGVPLMTAPRKNALITEVGKDGFEEARLRLACKLMHIDSKNLPGIDMLPRGVDLPAKWSEDELKELQWAPLQEAAKADKVFLEQAWQRLGVEAPLDAFVDAASVARRYAVPCVGASINDPETMVLLPESSIFERTAPRGGRMLLCSETDEVQIVSDGSHDLGTWGASMSSGWVTNDDLLLYEGWADPNLQSDAVPLSLDFLRGAAQGVLGQEEEVRRQQDQVLKSLERYQYLNLNDDDRCGPSLSILHGGYASDDLGKVLQVLSLTKEELEQYGIAGCAMNIGETVPLNVDHEQRVGKLLCSSSETLLRQFPTNIAEDEEILKREGLPNRLRQSVNSRLSRKRCLKQCMDIAKAWVERPTATASLRRPWKINIKTSG